MKFAYSQYNNRILYFSNFYPTLLHFYIITFVMLKIPNNDKFLIDSYGRKIELSKNIWTVIARPKII
jgi:hypothetical protein